MPELFDESENLTPDDEDNEEVSRLKKGFGRFLVLRDNLIIYQLDFAIKKTDCPKVREYLENKYKDCEIKEIR